MKLAILLTIICTLHAPTLINADRMVRYLFNNAQTSSYTCNSADDVLINNIFTLSGKNETYGKRNLRAVQEPTLQEQQRELVVYPPKCKNNCAGFATNTCRATDCVGYRRNLGKKEESDERELSTLAVSCTTQTNYINQELTKLINGNSLSSSCKTLLQKPRDVKCYNDVVYGVVEYFRMWDTDAVPQKVIDSNFVGENVCKDSPINFEAITNDCVDFLLTSVSGPNNFYADEYESERPFSVFGDRYYGDGTFKGMKLPYLGEYTLTALPDGLEEKKKVVKFKVVNC